MIRYTWHKAHLDRIRNDDNRLSNPFATSLRGVLVCLPTAILCVASISTLQNTEFNRWIVFGIASGGFWTFVIAVVLVRRLLLSFYCYRLWRFVRTLVFCAVIAFVVRVGLAWGSDWWEEVGGCGTAKGAAGMGQVGEVSCQQKLAPGHVHKPTSSLLSTPPTTQGVLHPVHPRRV